MTGVQLMEKAFGAKNPIVRLSGNDNEQRGAMELYRGVTAFVRNHVGHHLSGDYNQNDAFRFVVMVDLLLKFLIDAVAISSE